MVSILDFAHYKVSAWLLHSAVVAWKRPEATGTQVGVVAVFSQNFISRNRQWQRCSLRPLLQSPEWEECWPHRRSCRAQHEGELACCLQFLWDKPQRAQFLQPLPPNPKHLLSWAGMMKVSPGKYLCVFFTEKKNTDTLFYLTFRPLCYSRVPQTQPFIIPLLICTLSLSP